MSESVAYSNRNKDLISKIIHKQIDDHIDKDVKSIFLFDIFLTDYSITIEYIVLREEWLNCLCMALNYFEECEDYETCGEIKNTMVKLKQQEYRFLNMKGA